MFKIGTITRNEKGTENVLLKQSNGGYWALVTEADELISSLDPAYKQDLSNIGLEPDPLNFTTDIPLEVREEVNRVAQDTNYLVEELTPMSAVNQTLFSYAEGKELLSTVSKRSYELIAELLKDYNTKI